MRRLMVKIANIIAERNEYGALVTGESVGQVASQTLKASHSVPMPPQNIRYSALLSVWIRRKL